MAMRILVALLFMPVAAFAADWVLIAADQGLEIEIDRQSARPNKGAWFKYINTPPLGQACSGSKKVGEFKSYIEANCKEFTLRTKQRIAYAEDGSVLNYCGFNDPKAGFSEYAPETVGEVYFRAICDPNGRVRSLSAWLVREDKLSKPLSAEKKPVKPLFAECKYSNECEGNLLCKVVAGSASSLCLEPD